MRFAFCASPGAFPPKSPIAAKEKVLPSVAAVLKVAVALLSEPSPTLYVYVVPPLS